MFWLSILPTAYAAIVLVVWLQQDRMLFPGAEAEGVDVVPSVQGVTTDRLRLPSGPSFRVAVGRAHGTCHGVLLFFVGNGEDLRSGVEWAGELAAYGMDTVVPEYPGYGASEGEPSFESCLAAADVALQFARQRAEQVGGPLVVGGSSLGTFLATHVAATGAPARMILLAPPTSVADVGSRRFPWLPVRLLIRHPFDNVGTAPDVHCPVLVVHGDEDDVVPLDMGRRVAEVLGGDLLVAHGFGHSRGPLQPDGPFAPRIGAFLRGRH